MNHFPRLLGSNKKGEEHMDDKQQKRHKPKLDRRNAAKNFEYDASTSPSSSDDRSLHVLRTRSLELPSYSDRTSFRVGGTDGEIDEICRTLGLSGPEDFAIPAAAWEERKARSSSDLLPRSRLHQQSSYPESSSKEEEQEGEVEDGSSVRLATRVRFSDELVQENVSAPLKNYRDWTDLGSSAGGRGGIRGIRPPVLTPPPSVAVPYIDNNCSTWDIFKSFAPQDGDASSSIRVYVSSSDEENETYEEDEEVFEPHDGPASSLICVEANSSNEAVDGEVGKREIIGVTLEETTVLCESCSFTTSNDDDSSSTTTDPMSSISPIGRLKRNITSWLQGELLGSGSFGKVYEAIADDGFFFAVKEVSLLDQGSQGKQSIYQLEQEIALLSQFEHENIVQYLGTHKDEEKLYIFIELVTKGSLANLYSKYPLRDSTVSAYTRQILNGLKYLHNQNVVHRDIKCANILVAASGYVKLADFGLAKATKLNDVKSCKGTAFWMAPEVVNRKNHGYGLAADIWSLGCTVLEMLTRKLPYSPLECMQALFRIGRGEPPLVPTSLSKDAQDFIHQCLQVNPDNRPTAAQLLYHPFVKTPLSAASGSISSLQHNERRS